MDRDHDRPLRGGATADDHDHMDHHQADRIAHRIEAVNDLGLPAHPQRSEPEGW